ncbi:hypothetical protein SLS62_006603 [Diatrype stigma]|uniref:Uncharacterized protein n=1 Tax=Diatrype stigma TaxID=117547 RepID=A0AAN9UQU3_9PEZI
MASPVRKKYDDPMSPVSSRDYSTRRNYAETATTTAATQDDRSVKTANQGNGGGGGGRARGESITSTTTTVREPIELSGPIVPEIYDPAYKRPVQDSAPTPAAEWDFLRVPDLKPARGGGEAGWGDRSDVSSTGAVANNIIAPRFSISDRKRQLGLGLARPRPDDFEEEQEKEPVIIEESEEQVTENLAKATLNLTLNELLTKTKTQPAAAGEGA